MSKSRLGMAAPARFVFAAKMDGKLATPLVNALDWHPGRQGRWIETKLGRLRVSVGGDPEVGFGVGVEFLDATTRRLPDAAALLELVLAEIVEAVGDMRDRASRSADPVEDEDLECFKCNGTGQSEHRAFDRADCSPCTACGGSGRAELEDKDVRPVT